MKFGWKLNVMYYVEELTMLIMVVLKIFQIEFHLGHTGHFQIRKIAYKKGWGLIIEIICNIHRVDSLETLFFLFLGDSTGEF